MNHGLAAAAILMLAVACTSHGTTVRSAPPSSTSTTGWTITSSSSLPGAPECQKQGVLAQATQIAEVDKTDQAKAQQMYWAASPDVRTCLSTPTMESTEVGVQQVSP